MCGTPRRALSERNRGRCRHCGTLLYLTYTGNVSMHRNFIRLRVVRRLTSKQPASFLRFHIAPCPYEAFSLLAMWQGGSVTRYVNRGSIGGRVRS